MFNIFKTQNNTIHNIPPKNKEKNLLQTLNIVILEV